jgi:hypothetical protein
VSYDGVATLDSFPFSFIAAFLLPILDVTSRSTRMHSGVEERGGGAAHRDKGEVAAQFLDVDLEITVVLEQRKMKGPKR